MTTPPMVRAIKASAIAPSTVAFGVGEGRHMTRQAMWDATGTALPNTDLYPTELGYYELLGWWQGNGIAGSALSLYKAVTISSVTTTTELARISKSGIVSVDVYVAVLATKFYLVFSGANNICGLQIRRIG